MDEKALDGNKGEASRQGLLEIMSIVALWNEGFSLPRGLRIVLDRTGLEVPPGQAKMPADDQPLLSYTETDPVLQTGLPSQATAALISESPPQSRPKRRPMYSLLGLNSYILLSRLRIAESTFRTQSSTPPPPSYRSQLTNSSRTSIVSSAMSSVSLLTSALNVTDQTDGTSAVTTTFNDYPVGEPSQEIVNLRTCISSFLAKPRSKDEADQMLKDLKHVLRCTRQGEEYPFGYSFWEDIRLRKEIKREVRSLLKAAEVDQWSQNWNHCVSSSSHDGEASGSLSKRRPERKLRRRNWRDCCRQGVDANSPGHPQDEEVT